MRWRGGGRFRSQFVISAFVAGTHGATDQAVATLKNGFPGQATGIAVAAEYLILGDPITPWLVAGGTIMLAGVALAQSGSRGH
jgi:drug/metabolite transporter (DMT)-like permease